ncbi:MAG: hypothetical protein OXG08_06015 [Gammaproteobacteria bacterium]|nr:hypothetical protein [Gammaproteobacteria bacterium]
MPNATWNPNGIQQVNIANSRMRSISKAILFCGFGALASVQLLAEGSTSSADNKESLGTNPYQDSNLGSGSFTLPNPKGIDELTKIKSEFLRSVVLRRMLANTDVQGVMRLFDQAKKVTHPNLRSRLQKTLVQKLTTLDPQQSLNIALDVPTLNRSRLVEAVFIEWFISDLDEAVKTASSLDYSERLVALKTLVQIRDDLPSSELQKFADDLGHGGRFRGLVEELTERSACIDPRSSWNALSEDPWLDSTQKFVFLDIARAWIDADGRQALFEIADSIQNHATRVDLIERLIDEIAETDPEEAFWYAKNLYGQTDGSVFYDAVREWAKSDPRAALEAVSQLDSHMQRLKLQYTIATSWARNDPRDFLTQNLDKFSTTARSAARSYAIDQIAKISPEEAKVYLSEIPQSEIESVAVRIATRLSDTDVQEAIDWIKTDANVIQHQQRLFRVVLDELLEEDLEAAMQFAQDHSTDTTEDGLEFKVLRYIVNGNEIEQALEFLPRMQEGHGKFAAHMDVALNLIVNKDIDRALELGDRVDSEHRRYFFSAVLESWAHYDPQGMYEALDDLSDKGLRLQAAQALRYNNKSLSEEQIQYVESLL